ncbi:hypothetical protein [Pollutimonas harenae]|uniref:Glycine zipper domain-containing protein n=1 Tax=Pollutimonas harenae TaxID=657015 RepID=A0A853GX89_9BURK|nr:hypothetical protein [Pollutimonas harenae]NYT86971.1 hypothetical protein [Pollutimonas harenae]TEA69272.1 hypothetical protein ERD84_15485 [Pollutimonas harenae]
MRAQGNFGRLIVVGLMAFALAGCASSYDRRANNTMMGAGLGAAAGAVVSGGDPVYALGGAAAGGLLGNILTQERSYDDRYDDRHREYRRSRRDDYDGDRYYRRDRDYDRRY